MVIANRYRMSRIGLELTLELAGVFDGDSGLRCEFRIVLVTGENAFGGILGRGYGVKFEKQTHSTTTNRCGASGWRTAVPELRQHDS